MRPRIIKITVRIKKGINLSGFLLLDYEYSNH